MDTTVRTHLVYLYSAAIFFPLMAPAALLMMQQLESKYDPLTSRHAQILIWFAGVLVIPWAIATLFLTGWFSLAIMGAVLLVHVGLLGKTAWSIKNEQALPSVFAWYVN